MTVHELVLESWDEAATEDEGEGHRFAWPSKVMSEEDKAIFDKSKKVCFHSDSFLATNAHHCSVRVYVPPHLSL